MARLRTEDLRKEYLELSRSQTHINVLVFMCLASLLVTVSIMCWRFNEFMGCYTNGNPTLAVTA